MRLVNLIAQILIPAILSVLGAYLGGLFGGVNTKSTIYWVTAVMFIGFINAFTSKKYDEAKQELDDTKDKLSSLLIKKEIKSSGLDTALYPRILHDNLEKNRVNDIQLIINSVHSTSNLPSVEIRSTKMFNLRINKVDIQPIKYLNKYIYLISDDHRTSVYSSKKFFLYDLEIEPVESGIYEMSIIAESEDFKTEKVYTFPCN